MFIGDVITEKLTKELIKVHDLIVDIKKYKRWLRYMKNVRHPLYHDIRIREDSKVKDKLNSQHNIILKYGEIASDQLNTYTHIHIPQELI